MRGYMAGAGGGGLGWRLHPLKSNPYYMGECMAAAKDVVSPCGPPFAGLGRSLVHKHIVRYLGTEVRESTLYIFTEWVSGGSLEKMLEQFPKLPEKVVAKYTQQVGTEIEGGWRGVGSRYGD